MTIRMDEGAAELLDTLHRAGYAAYVVGGCVRDSLLGLTPHDWDLCTSALPQQVMELFGAQRCIPTGLQHGTVTVKQSGALYEITTFRTEGTYTDGRHPDEVHFVPDVREDLARRDLTINAMAYNEKRALWTPLAGRPTCKAASYGRWVCPASGSPRTRCESCGCTASQPGLALPSTRPRRRRHRSCVPIWTAYRWSASRKSLQNCWPHPPLRHILTKNTRCCFARAFIGGTGGGKAGGGCLPGGCGKPAHPAGGAAAEPWRGRHPPHLQAPALLQQPDRRDGGAGAGSQKA